MTERTYIKPSWYVTKVANPMMTKLGMASKLTIPGRTSGEPRSVAVTPIEVEGAIYLLAVRGETDWVLNLRASGEGELSHKGDSYRFSATEVDREDQIRIVKAYQEQLGRPVAGYFKKLPDPADHPVFRVTRV